MPQIKEPLVKMKERREENKIKPGHRTLKMAMVIPEGKLSRRAGNTLKTATTKWTMQVLMMKRNPKARETRSCRMKGR